MLSQGTFSDLLIRLEAFKKKSYSVLISWMRADFFYTGFPPLLSFEVSTQLKSSPITIVSFANSSSCWFSLLKKNNLLGDIVRCVNFDENNNFLF